MKADPAEIGPEAHPEAESVCTTAALRGRNPDIVNAHRHTCGQRKHQRPRTLHSHPPHQVRVAMEQKNNAQPSRLLGSRRGVASPEAMETNNNFRERIRREQQLVNWLCLAMDWLEEAQPEQIWAVLKAYKLGLSIRQIAAATRLSPIRARPWENRPPQARWSSARRSVIGMSLKTAYYGRESPPGTR